MMSVLMQVQIWYTISLICNDEQFDRVECSLILFFTFFLSKPKNIYAFSFALFTSNMEAKGMFFSNLINSLRNGPCLLRKNIDYLNEQYEHRNWIRYLVSHSMFNVKTNHIEYVHGKYHSSMMENKFYCFLDEKICFVIISFRSIVPNWNHKSTNCYDHNVLKLDLRQS